MVAKKINGTSEIARGQTARILVVGEVSPLLNGGAIALSRLPKNSSWDRLRRLLGLSDADYDGCMTKTNLCAEKWHMYKARQRAREIWSSVLGRIGEYSDCDVLVMLGSRVREIFGGMGLGHVDYFGYRCLPHSLPHLKVVSLPHPSGRSRAWNDPSSRTRSIAVMSAVAPWVPWGKWSPGMSSPKFGAEGFNEASKETHPEESASKVLGDAAAEMYRIAADHGFHEKHVQGQVPEDFGAFCMNLVGEISELWEAFREGRLDVQCDKKCELTCAEEELADVVIRSMDTAVQLGVDLGRAVALKAAYNRTRPYKHGNKRA